MIMSMITLNNQLDETKDSVPFIKPYTEKYVFTEKFHSEILFHFSV